MFAELKKKLSSVSPQAAIVGLLIAFVAGSGLAWLLLRGGETVDADVSAQPMAARIDRVDGDVGIARVTDENTEPDWDEATINTPVSVGDRIYAREGSHTSIALTGRNFVRLDPGTSLDVLALSDQRTQLALRGGSAIFDVGALEPNAFYEVATPCGAVDFNQPGLYQIGIDNGNAIISVLSGLAQVVGASGSGYINKGEVYTLVGQAASEVVASTLAPRLAGGIVDDYYRYRYSNAYDGRYQNYDTYLSDPFYYDPYRSSASYGYVSADIPGLRDLDYYGDWSNVDGYGYCWSPRLSTGWAPFRVGSWDLYDPWGPTWVSTEPWGWAPYHYGRWAFVQQRWFWVPAEVRTHRAYCPAPVAFIPLTQTNQIGWVALAPGELYVPRYYNANFQPRYLASREVIREATIQRTFVNLNAPSGLTAVPIQRFRRNIDPSIIAQVDPRVIARPQQALDPFAVEGVRDVAIKSRGEGRERLKLARTEQEVLNRPVITSRTLAPLPAETNLAKALRVESVPGGRKNDKLKIDDTRQVITDRRPDGLPQANASDQIRTGKDRGQPGINPPTAQPPAAQEPVPQERQQMREQLKSERQQQSAAAAQAAGARQAEQQQMRQQRKEQKRLERQPPETTVQQQRTEQLKQQQQRQIQEQSRIRSQQDAARQAQQQRQQVQQQQRQQVQQPRQMQQQQQPQQKQNQQRKQEQPPRRKPPEGSVYQQQRMDQSSQMRERAGIQRAQQDSVRQQVQAQQQRQAVMQQQRQAVMQQQRQAEMQQRQAAVQQQRQAVMQQQRQAAMQQQAARAQAQQQQSARTQGRPQQLLGPPIRSADSPQASQRADKGKRKP